MQFRLLVPILSAFTSFLLPALFFLVWSSSVSLAAEDYQVDWVRLDGKASSISTELRVPPVTRDVVFHLQPPQVVDAEAPRVRYRLEGYDREWRDPGGEMRLSVRFLGEQGMHLSSEEFAVTGESGGWTGTLEGSRPVSRREVVEVPVGASALQLWTASGGPQQTVGVFGLEALAVTLEYGSKERPDKRIELLSASGVTAGKLRDGLDGWTPHGTAKEVATVLQRGDRPPMLVLRDERAKAHGGWSLKTDSTIALEGASRVVIEWREAFSVGWSGPAVISYSDLPSGNYVLKLRTFSVGGLPLGGEVSLPVSILPPLHQSSGFQWMVILLGSGALVASAYKLGRIRMKRLLVAAERERMQERERNLVVRELHESFGAKLANLGQLLDLVDRDKADPIAAKKSLGESFDVSKNLTRLSDEIGWLSNPSNDSLQALVPFLCNHLQIRFHDSGATFRFDLPDQDSGLPIGPVQRYYLFQAILDSVREVSKWNEKSIVHLSIRIERRQLHVTMACEQPLSRSAQDRLNIEPVARVLEKLGGEADLSLSKSGAVAILLTMPLER